MANWIENELTVTGSRNDQEAFLTAAAGSNAEGAVIPISFASLLPIPDDEEDPIKWAWDHWGTKADVWEWIGLERLPESFIACFATAWAAPTTLFETVSRQYPKLTLHLEYQDEDGGFLGSATIKRGETQLAESSDDNSEGKEDDSESSSISIASPA